MILLKLSKLQELLFIELRNTGKRYLQSLEINSCSFNGGWYLGCLIGYRSLAMDVLGKNEAAFY